MAEKEYSYDKENGLDKTLDFFKRNIYNILIFVISFVFIFKDVVQIQETGKTIPEIIASSVISFIVGTCLSIIVGKKGIIAGQNTESYRQMMNTYSIELERTNDNIDKLDDFCDIKNEKRIRKIQTHILRKARIRYEDFVTKTIEEVCKTKEQIKFWRKAEKVHIQLLTADNILSETDDRYEKGKKDLTLNEYERKTNTQDMVKKIIFALIFGYFGVTFTGNLENIIWGAVQISSWLIMALMNYIQNYTYVREVYQSKIYRKINLLIEFNNTYKNGGK